MFAETEGGVFWAGLGVGELDEGGNDPGVLRKAVYVEDSIQFHKVEEIDTARCHSGVIVHSIWTGRYLLFVVCKCMYRLCDILDEQHLVKRASMLTAAPMQDTRPANLRSPAFYNPSTVLEDH